MSKTAYQAVALALFCCLLHGEVAIGRSFLVSTVSARASKPYYGLGMSADDAVCKPMLKLFNEFTQREINRTESASSDTGESFNPLFRWETMYQAIFAAAGFVPPRQPDEIPAGFNITAYNDLYLDSIIPDDPKRYVYLYTHTTSMRGYISSSYIFKDDKPPKFVGKEPFTHLSTEGLVSVLSFHTVGSNVLPDNLSVPFNKIKTRNKDSGYILKKWNPGAVYSVGQTKRVLPQAPPSLYQNTLQYIYQRAGTMYWVSRMPHMVKPVGSPEIALVFHLTRTLDIDDTCYLVH